MLVLSRKKDEKVRIGDVVEVVVVEIRYDRVRLGFNAPQDVDVHREEVWQAIQKSGTNKFKAGPKVHRTEIED